MAWAFCSANRIVSIVLFLHGLGADSGSWFMQFEPLILEGMRPIAIDIPGFGK